VDLQTLKISQDPLFGVTVYELAGLFFENVGPVLAFCSRERPFAELTLSDMSKEARIEIVRGLVARFRVLETRSFGRWTPASTRFIEFVTTLRRKPQHAGAQLHLLVARRERGAHASAAAQAILVEQPSIVIQTAPWAPGGRRWSSWVECWLETIAVWPMQVRFVESAYQMSDYLRQIPASEFLDTLIIR
jgi:hypothetical protein